MSDSNSRDIIESQTATERVSVYCDTFIKEEWTLEAEESGYSSRSAYLYELVQESRRYRQQGFLSREKKQSKIRQLRAEVERLEAELETKGDRGHRLIQTLKNPELVKRVLSTRYQLLPGITEKVLCHDSLLLDARDPVERSLFDLAQRGDATYQRGHGWKLTDGEL